MKEIFIFTGTLSLIDGWRMLAHGDVLSGAFFGACFIVSVIGAFL